MRKISFIIICMTFILISGCYQPSNRAEKALKDIKELEINKITKICISFPPEEDAIAITDPEGIRAILDYFNYIYSLKTKSNQMDADGSTYILKFKYREAILAEISISDDEFIMAENHTLEIQQDEEISFDEIIGNALYMQFKNDNQYDVLVGKITFISTLDPYDEEDQIRTIRVDTSNYSYNMPEINIFNLVSSGDSPWYDIDIGDEIELYFCRNDNQDNNAPSAIFITKEAEVRKKEWNESM